MQTIDPYGVHPDLPEEYQQIGREYFARSPGSDVWVLFQDSPKGPPKSLWAKFNDWHEENDDLSWLF